MAADGIRRALAFVTSRFASYSGCRQYREDIERAIAAFKKLFPMNARPLQPINARSIVEDVTQSTHAAN